VSKSSRDGGNDGGAVSDRGEKHRTRTQNCTRMLVFFLGGCFHHARPSGQVSTGASPMASRTQSHFVSSIDTSYRSSCQFSSYLMADGIPGISKSAILAI
jgi:hypothetical protein